MVRTPCGRIIRLCGFRFSGARGGQAQWLSIKLCIYQYSLVLLSQACCCLWRPGSYEINLSVSYNGDISEKHWKQLDFLFSTHLCNTWNLKGKGCNVLFFQLLVDSSMTPSKQLLKKIMITTCVFLRGKLIWKWENSRKFGEVYSHGKLIPL